MAGILEQRELPPAISTSLLFEEIRAVERRLRRGHATTVQAIAADWHDDYQKLTFDEVIGITGLARGTLTDDWRDAVFGGKPVCRKEDSRCYWLCSWLRVHKNPERVSQKAARRMGRVN